MGCSLSATLFATSRRLTYDGVSFQKTVKEPVF